MKWSRQKRVLLITLLAGLEVAMCFWKNEEIDVQVYRLGTQWMYFPKAIVGTLMVLLLAQMIHSKWIVYLGKQTKELMILHYPPFYWTVAIQFVMRKMFEPNIIGGLIITAITVVGCLIIDKIMNRFRIWNFAMGK